MKILSKYFEYKNGAHVQGLTKELDVLYISEYFKTHKEDVLVLTSSLYEANNYYKELQTYVDDVLFFPMDDFLTSVAVAISPDLKIKRLEALEKLKSRKNDKYLIVTSLMGYLKYLPNVREEQEIVIDPSPQNISREIIIEKLEEFGYHRESLVTTTGEYAVRGFIIDVFPVEVSKPIRIEFFDNVVDEIKEFDENTQLTTKKISKAVIKRFNEMTSENPSSILDYMISSSLFVIDESQITTTYTNLQKEIFDYKVSKNIDKNKRYMFEFNELHCDKIYKIDTINSYKSANTLTYSSKEIINFNSDYEKLMTYSLNEIHNKRTVIFALENKKQIDIISKLFNESYQTSFDNIYEEKINIVIYHINKGFIFQNYTVICPYDIDNAVSRTIKYKNTIKIGKKIKSYDDLQIGDYIVHETYGIGIYNGLKTLKTNHLEKDYIQLSYLDNDKVYIPVENIDKLYKYSSKDGIVPKINKLNSTSWAKKKLETRKKIHDISEELLNLYSKRTSVKTKAYKDYDEEFEFALAFPYILTEDQEKAIKEIDYDLKSEIPMDRLLCGDVGYGKTEVAFRAMFKTVLNGFQVAYLCPTTILSKQQYTNALERFKNYPIRIELLNRHVSTKKVNEILNDLEEGKIDIIIGTHKLLNKKFKYKHLGLLVIDEEQRFGVSHKEKIKEMKTDINVLTLSATPIPRTLKMAMSGLRSLSILDTPPINRYPIQTYVIEENDLIIRDAIYKELTRNGQIFILINNIDELEKFKTKIDKLVPEAKTVYGHGQMSSDKLNDIMERFIQGEYDILICTTIIETGIDIPNVNTIIIMNSDRFGLSQLYQIRGRVGRSDKIAYAYLMYNPSKVLTETAVKRLESIKEFTELGSGYKIAMRDLAIRGAGDLLGSEQAGFIDSVGIDLYTKMVNEEIHKLTNNITDDSENTEEDKTPSLNINTHIDNAYVEDESIKIEIHKLINSIKSKEDYLKVKSELIDRFGNINEDIEIYMLEKCVENMFEKLHIKNIMQLQKRITIVLPKELSDKIDGEKLFLQVYNISPKFELSYMNKEIRISVNTDLLSKNYVYYIFDLLNVIEEQVKNV